MKTYIGIDFGACNIKAAQISSGGRIQDIQLNKHLGVGKYTPNVILYDKIKDTLEIKVGKGAKNSPDTENKIWQIKPKLLQKNWSKFIKSLGRDVTDVEAVENIFVWIWKTITERFSTDENFDVTITTPVAFSEVQKNIIKNAAINAGVPVTNVVTEPFAAMFSVDDFLDEDDEQVILIFDFGGSTLDLSLFKIECDDDEIKFTEMAASGLKFGGIDIDKAIFENILNVKYSAEIKEILESGTPKIEILNEIEVVKEAIFGDEEETAEGFLTDKRGGIHSFTVTRDEIISVLEKMKIKEKIVALLDELFEDAEIDKSEVTTVKPFGGTSTINYFPEMLTEYFGAEIFDSEDFESEEIYMGVARGAAKYRYTVEKENSGVIIQNVIPYSIGLAKNGMFSRYIKRNEISGFVTPLKPLLISELEKDNWSVAVYQSFSNEFDLPLDGEDVIFIGDVKLDKKLYSVKDAILFNLKTDGAGQICMSFFELHTDSDEPKLIEEKIVKVG